VSKVRSLKKGSKVRAPKQGSKVGVLNQGSTEGRSSETLVKAQGSDTGSKARALKQGLKVRDPRKINYLKIVVLPVFVCDIAHLFERTDCARHGVNSLEGHNLGRGRVHLQKDQ
jgi:hypothetical protein